jgi:hypothetical protein
MSHISILRTSSKNMEIILEVIIYTDEVYRFPDKLYWGVS